MALANGVFRRVQASKVHDDSDYDNDSQNEEALSEIERTTYGKSQRQTSIQVESSQLSGPESESADKGSGDGLPSGSEDEEVEPDPKAILSNISFGDLATAQASLDATRNRKRKRDTSNQDSSYSSSTSQSRSRSRSPSPFHEANERLAGKSHKQTIPAARTSKHAPVEQSSKKAVSRRRTVVSAPKVLARDPRFSDLSGNLSANRIAQNYAFLNQYRADEMAQLKAEIRAARDAATKERLVRDLRAMEDRERARKRVEDEKAVVREHRKHESQAVSKGKKPFFLKKAEVRKQVLVKRFEGLGEKKVEKIMERRRRKKAMKERKAMPNNRREVG